LADFVIEKHCTSKKEKKSIPADIPSKFGIRYIPVVSVSKLGNP
jgi:hypothetical protein